MSQATKPRHHRAPAGLLFVRLIRHSDVFGLQSEKYAESALLIRCSRCRQPAVQLDEGWPERNEGTLCGEHLRGAAS